MLRARIIRGTWAAVMAGVLMTAAAGLVSTGCSIRTQGPIKEVAYDFSDRDFYDRAYAPSPKYLETDPIYDDQPIRTRRAAELAPTGAPVEVAPAPIAASLPAVILAPGAPAGVASPASEPVSVPAPAEAEHAAQPRPAMVQARSSALR